MLRLRIRGNGGCAANMEALRMMLLQICDSPPKLEPTENISSVAEGRPAFQHGDCSACVHVDVSDASGVALYNELISVYDVWCYRWQQFVRRSNASLRSSQQFLEFPVTLPDIQLGEAETLRPAPSVTNNSTESMPSWRNICVMLPPVPLSLRTALAKPIQLEGQNTPGNTFTSENETAASGGQQQRPSRVSTPPWTFELFTEINNFVLELCGVMVFALLSGATHGGSRRLAEFILLLVPGLDRLDHGPFVSSLVEWVAQAVLGRKCAWAMLPLLGAPFSTAELEAVNASGCFVIPRGHTAATPAELLSEFQRAGGKLPEQCPVLQCAPCQEVVDIIDAGEDSAAAAALQKENQVRNWCDCCGALCGHSS